jgi:hypothetical protein
VATVLLCKLLQFVILHGLCYCGCCPFSTAFKSPKSSSSWIMSALPTNCGAQQLPAQQIESAHESTTLGAAVQQQHHSGLTSKPEEDPETHQAIHVHLWYTPLLVIAALQHLLTTFWLCCQINLQQSCTQVGWSTMYSYKLNCLKHNSASAAHCSCDQ